MGRRIPGVLLPHQATITLARGNGSTGLLWEGAPLAPRRAQFDGAGARLGRQITVGAVDRTVIGRVFLDVMSLPLGSKVLSSVDGETLLVGEVRRYSGGGLDYIVATLVEE